MTNIEAQTIGALARLEHQLMVDVARHLREMAPKPSEYQQAVAVEDERQRFNDAMVACLRNSAVFASGGVGGASASTTTGGGPGGWIRIVRGGGVVGIVQ